MFATFYKEQQIPGNVSNCFMAFIVLWFSLFVVHEGNRDAVSFVLVQIDSLSPLYIRSRKTLSLIDTENKKAPSLRREYGEYLLYEQIRETLYRG